MYRFRHTTRAGAPGRAAISTIFFCNGAGVGLWASHIPFVTARTDLDVRTLGWVLLAVAAGAMAAMPLAGWLTSRRGSRPITIGASWGFAIALPLLVAAPGVPSLFLAALFFGALNGSVDVAMNANAGDVEKSLGRPVMSSFHGFFSLGGMAGAAVGGVLLARGLGGWPGMTVTSLAMALAFAFAMPRLLNAPAFEGPPSPSVPRMTALLLGALALLCMVVEGAMVDWSALLLQTRAGASPGAAAAGYSAFSIAMAACRFAGDGLVLRLGAFRVTVLGGLAIFAGLVLATSSTTYAVAATGLAIVGLGAANVVPLIFAAASRIPGVPAGAGVATVATIGYAGFLAGPPVIGWIASVTGLAVALGLLSLCGAAIALAAGAVRGPRAPPT